MDYAANAHSGNKESAAHPLSRQQIIEHVKKSLLYTPFDVRWLPMTPTMVVVGQYPNNHGALSLYQIRKGEMHTMLEMRVPHPLKCCTFGHNISSSNNTTDTASSVTVGLGDFVGGVRVVDVELLPCSTLNEADDHASTGNDNKLSNGSVRPNGVSSSTASRAVQDKALEYATRLHIPHAHSSIVNAIDGARYDGPPELATGGRDGAVKVWDTRQASKPVVALQPTDPTRARDCWTVRLGNSLDADERVLVAGFDNGDVKLFDLRTQKMLHEMNVCNGVCDVVFDRPDIAMNKLLVASLEGQVRCYDLRTRHDKLGYAYVEKSIGNSTVWSVRALPQNREVFMAGGGGELTLCRYVYPPERSVRDSEGQAKGVAGAIEELNKVRISDQPINAMDWHSGKEGLLACTAFDQSVRVMLVTKLQLIK